MKKAIATLVVLITLTCLTPKAKAEQPFGFGYRLQDQYSVPLNMAIPSLINYGFYKSFLSDYDQEDINKYGEEKVKKAALAQSILITTFIVTLLVPAIEYQIGDADVNQAQAEKFWRNQLAAWSAIGISSFLIYRF